MDKHWIIDVLGDLRTFASKNDLPLLESQLEETVRVAAKDVAESEKRTHLRVIEGNGAAQGTVHRKARARTNA